MPYVDTDPRRLRRRLTGLGWLCIPGLASPAAVIASVIHFDQHHFSSIAGAVYSGMWLVATAVGWIYRADTGKRLLTSSSREDLECEVSSLKVQLHSALKRYKDESDRAARIAEAVIENKPLPAPEPVVTQKPPPDAIKESCDPPVGELAARLGVEMVSAPPQVAPAWRWVIGPDGTRTLENSATTVVPAPPIQQNPAPGVVNIGVVNQYFGIQNQHSPSYQGSNWARYNTCGVSFGPQRTGS